MFTLRIWIVNLWSLFVSLTGFASILYVLGHFRILLIQLMLKNIARYAWCNFVMLDLFPSCLMLVNVTSNRQGVNLANDLDWLKFQFGYTIGFGYLMKS